jgi:hypothetical protein
LSLVSLESLGVGEVDAVEDHLELAGRQLNNRVRSC